MDKQENKNLKQENKEDDELDSSPPLILDLSPHKPEPQHPFTKAYPRAFSPDWLACNSYPDFSLFPSDEDEKKDEKVETHGQEEVRFRGHGQGDESIFGPDI